MHLFSLETVQMVHPFPRVSSGDSSSHIVDADGHSPRGVRHTARSEQERREGAAAASQAEACRFVLSRLADEAANVYFGASSGMKTSFGLLKSDCLKVDSSKNSCGL